MRLYSGLSPDFIQDTVRNQVADKLSAAFFATYRYKPSHGEVNSWRNSLRAMAQVIQHADLMDNGVLLEYQLPLSSKRLDCMISGRGSSGLDEAVIVELKQWEGCAASTADNLVSSWVGGRHREMAHPSVQVGQYHQYLEDCHSAFYEGATPIRLGACCYLHNYSPKANDPLLEEKFASILASYPLFAADGVDELSEFLKQRLASGGGRSVLDRIESSTFRAGRKLMEHVAGTIDGQRTWILLDEQLVVFEKILDLVRSKLNGRKKQVVIIRGGPGTGKSVIAIKLLAELLRRNVNAHYATGSKAFTETLWSILGSRSKALLRYFNSYKNAEYGTVDVLICDEAHRIRETSNIRFTPKALRSTKPQVHEILDASKLSIFFVDDRQVVRPNEIGSSLYIRDQATQRDCELSEFELEVQFRCAGSDGFVNWINNTLGIERTANVLWDGAEGFEFKIVDTVWDLEAEIRARASEGATARVAAGFCWPWSKPRPDGTLVEDVVVGDYRRPWDAKPGNWKLAPGIPSASLWATDPNGIEQVGCVYNIQGFEVDYIGVIWGRDLVYDFDAQEWVGNKKESSDQVVKRSKERFVDLVRNTYRVLLSRGLKGCYIYFMDKDTERFVRSRVDTADAGGLAKVAEPQPPAYGEG